MIYTQVGNVKAAVHTQTFPSGEVMVSILKSTKTQQQHKVRSLQRVG